VLYRFSYRKQSSMSYKTSSALVLLQLLTIVIGCCAARKPPNLLFFLADDLGYGEVSQHSPKYAFPENAFAKDGGKPFPHNSKLTTLDTPNLARFSSQSIRLTMSYAGSCECGPSRAAIFSEMQSGVVPVRGNGLIDEVDVATQSDLAVDLKTHKGYHTAYFGKWGLGFTVGAPWNHGFDQFVGHLGTTDSHYVFPHSLIIYNATNGDAIPKSVSDFVNYELPLPGNVGKFFSESSCALKASSSCTYDSDIFQKYAMEFISNPQNYPFYMVWAPTYPHAGQYYVGGKNGYPIKRITPWRKNTMDRPLRDHASQIEQHMDGDIGILLDFLEANPAVDNSTFIVFSSDNGATDEVKGYSYLTFHSSGGLRGYKRSMFEGGLRAPTMVRYRGVLAEGTQINVPNSLIDIGPTFREVAGLPPKFFSASSGQPGGAVSIYQTLLTNGNVIPDRTWLHFERCNEYGVDSSCEMATYDLRFWTQPEGPIYKLIIPFNKGPLTLFDVRTDYLEKTPIRNLPEEVDYLLNLTNRIRIPFTFPAPIYYTGPTNYLF